MFWKSIEYLKARVVPPEGFQIDHLHESEVTGLILKLAAWFPEVRVSGERCHLTTEFYELKCQLKGQTEDRRIFPVVIKYGGEIVAMTTIEKDRDDLTVTGRMSVVDPAYRGRGLGNLGTACMECLGRGAGAELAYFFTTLRIPQEQLISERNGYTLVGILPSSDREVFEDGTIHRVPEAMYAKCLTGGELFSTEGLSLTPRTQELWDFLKQETETFQTAAPGIPDHSLDTRN